MVRMDLAAFTKPPVGFFQQTWLEAISGMKFFSMEAF